MGDFVEKLANQFLFLDELERRKRVRGELNRLIKAVFTAVRDIDYGQGDFLKATVEAIRLGEFVLEIRRTGEHQAGDVGPIITDEMLRRELSNLGKVVLTFF